MDEKEAPEGKSLEEPELRESLAAAYDKLESGDEEPDEGGEEDPGEDQEAGADPAEGEEESEEELEEEPEEEEGLIEAHWSEDLKGVVSELDPDKAQIIADNYKAAENRANEKFEESAKARKLYEELNVDTLEPLLKQAGVTPQAYFSEIMKVEQAFRQNPAGTIAAMMQQAGLNNEQGISKIQEAMGVKSDDSYVDPDVKALNDKIAGLETKLQERDASSQQQQLQEANAKIEAFKKETVNGELAHPHFERVESAMAGLIQSGQARDLPEAYDKAIRLDDELYNDILSKREQSVIKAREAKRKESVQKSKAASRNATGKKSSSAEKDYPDDIKKHLEQVYDELEAG